MSAVAPKLPETVAAPTPAPRSNAAVWTGRVLSTLPVLMMLMSSVMKLAHAPQVVESWGSKFGYPPSTLTPIGLTELACVVLYVIPHTAVLGAVLVGGYLAAAFATHLRVGDPGGALPLVLGIVAWGGLYLRDERLRSLLPFRRSR
jgi:hypothetical protein